MSLVVSIATFALLSGAFLTARGRRFGNAGSVGGVALSRSRPLVCVVIVFAASAVLFGMVLSVKEARFDRTRHDLQQFGALMVTLDDTLRVYGADVDTARWIVFTYAQATIRGERFEGGDLALDDPFAVVHLRQAVRLLGRLAPTDVAQAQEAASARQELNDLIALRAKLIAESDDSDPPSVIVVAVIWLALLFTLLGFTVPSHPAVTTGIVSASLAAAVALFFLIELSSAFTGLIVVSDQPIRQALLMLDRP